MHIEKSKQSAAANIIRHAHRLIANDRNPDIDIERTKIANLCITPYIKEVNGEICDVTTVVIKDDDVVNPITRENYFTNRSLIQKLEYKHYKARKSEVFCYNRSDINTLINFVITCPSQLTSENDIDKFFDSTVSFLSQRYGSSNLISAVRHFDENEIGREHLHISLIPICPIDKEELLSKRNHVKAMENYDEKISANDVITRHDIKTLHRDFQKYIDSTGLKCSLVTKPEGSGKSINLSVEQLKEITSKTGITIDKPITIEEFANMLSINREIKIVDAKLKEKIKKLEKENSQLQEKVKALEKQVEHQQSRTWQRPQRGFVQNNGWNNTKDQEVKY